MVNNDYHDYITIDNQVNYMYKELNHFGKPLIYQTQSVKYHLKPQQFSHIQSSVIKEKGRCNQFRGDHGCNCRNSWFGAVNGAAALRCDQNSTGYGQ